MIKEFVFCSVIEMFKIVLVIGFINFYKNILFIWRCWSKIILWFEWYKNKFLLYKKMLEIFLRG